MDTSYLSQQLTTIVKRLHGLYDEIGVASHERDSRDAELLSALSETMNNQLNLVTKEKHALSEEAEQLIKTTRQMEKSLDDSRDHENDGLAITYPLFECLRNLKEKNQMVARLHRERFEQVRKLVEALDSYASHLEPSYLKIKLPPTDPKAQLPPTFDLGPTYVNSLDSEFTRVYEEYNRRLTLVTQTAHEIVNLWSELGTPQAQIDSNIVQFAAEAPEQLGLHQDDLRRLAARRDKLVSEKSQRERKLKDLRATVEALWNRLSVDDAERKRFLAANRGCGLRQINEFEDELSRLNELKRQNLHIFVEDARFRLQELWDDLYFSEEEMLEFTPAFSDVYSDALLSAHEQEIARLEALKGQRAPILSVIDKHKSLIKDRDDLAQSSQDASRLMAKGQKGEKRDPGKLLREEKMRKRIAKDLPKVEAELRKTLEAWEDEYGRPFCVHGERYLDELDAAPAKATPARSKTPVAREPKSASRAPPSQSRNGTMRSKTPTMKMAPSGRASPTKAPTGRNSPSKIPSRLPMSSVRDGPNSPERRAKPTYQPQSICAPPPRMRDLFVPPTERDRSGSVVWNEQDSMAPPPRPQIATSPHAYRPMSRAEYPTAPPSRQLSNTSSVAASSVASQVSGSENWETYTDASEADEADAREAYYAKVKAQQGRKRSSPAPTNIVINKRAALERDVIKEHEDAQWSDLGEVF